MAGDWIKIEKATARKPEIFGIAAKLSVNLDQAFAMCIRFWFWCDDQITDGNAKNVTPALLDDAIGVTGFAESLISVGWLQVRNSSLVIPNFDRHLSESAKIRCETNRRVAKSRQNKKRECNGNDVTSALQKPLPEKRREQKRRAKEEEKEPPFPLDETSQAAVVVESSGQTIRRDTFLTAPAESFDRFWGAYPRKIGRKRAADEWDSAIFTVMQQRQLNQVGAEQWLIDMARQLAASRLARKQPEFLPSPETFLNAERFNDDPNEWERDNDRSSKSGKSTATERSLDALSEWAAAGVTGGAET